MPFDKTFLLRPTPAPISGVDSGTTYTPSITLGTYGTYPNGIIIQVLAFEGYYAADIPMMQLRFPQIASPDLAPGLTPLYKVFAKQTINNITLLANQFWFGLTEIPPPVKINGFTNTTLNMSVFSHNDAVITGSCEFLIKIRIIGF